jgi:hypothetical protein
MRKVIACALALALTVCGAVSASTNVAPLWNSLANGFNFDSYPASASATFASSYNGSNFTSDFIGIINGINQILVSPSFPIDDDDEVLVSPSFPIDDDDTLNDTIENWPF